ncbi:MAG: COR domain-containing protein [Chloroflexota bacterium]
MPHDQPYLLAEKKIQEALKSGETKLDLRGGPFIGSPKLTDLPESLWQLTQLQELDLSDNQLRTLPESLGQLTQLQELDLSDNQLRALPESLEQLTELLGLKVSSNQLEALPDSLWQLTQLHSLDLSRNQLKALPESLGRLTFLYSLDLGGNPLTSLPESLGCLSNLGLLTLGDDREGSSIGQIPQCVSKLIKLRYLWLHNCQLENVPDWIGRLTELENLRLENNKITDLPHSISQLGHLKNLFLDNNPLTVELAEADKLDLDAIKAYLRAKAHGQIILNEAKLILVGEGEVGKTCLMDALVDKEWRENLSTHGIEIQRVKASYPIGDESGPFVKPFVRSEKIITLNGWDFGGQRVYRPTHQLFFSAPAVYLVVWKPREGPQQGFVKEWIQLVKRREPSAKILVVATHGGPQQRQPDIDRQELWDLFGKDTVVDFFFVDSKPDEQGHRKGIAELKQAIARVAATLPEVGRSVPKSFADVRAALAATGVPYLPLDEVLAICRAHHMDDEIARLFITISHRLGHLTHYENDPQLRDIVILRPDWLATAMSYVLDDEQTRLAHGLVKFSRLGQLWDDSSRAADSRYPATLHPIFLRLMERFDLSYRVADPTSRDESNPLSLIGQLVPDIRPTNIEESAWPPAPSSGDLQQTQICRIVDAGDGQSASAEGLFYQLIVRLHKYSLGRVDYTESVHWQRGLVLDNAYNGRAFLEHKGNDIHITVRAPYPEFFLAMLTSEVKYLVESFWEGLRCEVTVPCLNPKPCIGLFEIEKLIENKRRGRPEVPCPICNVWQSTDQLLLNAPAATQPISLDYLQKEFAQVKDKLDEVNTNTQRVLSQVDKQFADLIQLYTDEAKEGPRLFSLFPVDGNKFNPQTWLREKFRLVLWCEHSRLPLPAINGIESKKGVYDFELDRDWFKRAVPFLKFMTGTLSLVLPMMSSTLKVVDDTAFKTLESQLSLGKSVIDFLSGEGTKLGEVMGAADTSTLERGVGTRAENATLRELHALIKAKDPSNSFGGLVRVLNKRNEFLWVHENFASEY